MKKKLTVILALILTFAFVGCGNDERKQQEGDLSIMVYAAGYGTKWVDESIRIFNETHEGVKVISDGDPLAFETIKTKLENNKCEYDIILVAGTEYEQMVSKGFLENLDSVYSSTIPDSTKTVKEVVNKQLYDTWTINNSIYGVPWQTNCASGLVYNVEMFDRYGWTLPETMDELWQLCEKIDEDTNGKIAPLTFGGADGYGYTSWNTCQWLCEYYGYDAMIEFLHLASPEAYSNQAEGRTKVYETLTKLTMGTMSSGRKIALEGSVGALAVTAQTNFVNGKAAMLICGSWFPTEMQPYTDITQFKSGFCPMPHINSDKKSGDGTIDTSNIRFSQDGNLMAISSTSKNKELAKEFLVSMFTKKSYTSFVQSNNGLVRQVEGLEVDSSSFDLFTKQVYDYYNFDGNSKFVYLVSRDRLMEKGVLATFLAYKGAFFSEITKQSDYEKALSVAKKCVASELSEVNAHWNATTKQWF